MTTGKLIDKLRRYLALDRGKQEGKHAKLRALLKKLKKRQRVLEQKLKKAPDAKTRKRIKTKLKVLHAQRKKGVKLWRDIDGRK